MYSLSLAAAFVMAYFACTILFKTTWQRLVLKSISMHLKDYVGRAFLPFVICSSKRVEKSVESNRCLDVKYKVSSDFKVPATTVSSIRRNGNGTFLAFFNITGRKSEMFENSHSRSLKVPERTCGP
jgi:hypothetical protein